MITPLAKEGILIVEIGSIIEKKDESTLSVKY